jgi:signal transduction histidine kinase
MVRGLLTYSRGTSPAMPEALVDVLREDVALLEPIARSRKVKIDITPDAAPTAVDIDRSELRQVLSNLLLNAIQSMPKGGRVSVTVGRGELPGRIGAWVHVVVEDNGVGIPSEMLSGIFDPFTTTKPQREGAGLGLAVARRIVTRQGGTIDVESERDRGSRFTVCLPERSST